MTTAHTYLPEASSCRSVAVWRARSSSLGTASLSRRASSRSRFRFVSRACASSVGFFGGQRRLAVGLLRIGCFRPGFGDLLDAATGQGQQEQPAVAHERDVRLVACPSRRRLAAGRPRQLGASAGHRVDTGRCRRERRPGPAGVRAARSCDNVLYWSGGNYAGFERALTLTSMASDGGQNDCRGDFISAVERGVSTEAGFEQLADSQRGPED